MAIIAADFFISYLPQEPSTVENVLYMEQDVAKLSKNEVAALSRKIGKKIVAVDQEGGGRATRLKGEGFLKLPAAREIGENEAYLLAKTMGEQMREVGITFNLAPVVDLDSNPQNPVIGARSFGSDPDRVIAVAEKMLAGYRDAGVAVCLKHFPGHGDTTQDSHLHLSRIDKTVEELQKGELKPFRALAEKADAIMTAHILVPALDPDNPATCSEKILTGLLRREWRYEGVVVSDSLTMRAVAPDQQSFEKTVASVSEAAVRAFNAGCDLLILGRIEWADFTPTPEQEARFPSLIFQNFSRAVEEGRISQERLRASRLRIENLRSHYGSR